METKLETPPTLVEQLCKAATAGGESAVAQVDRLHHDCVKHLKEALVGDGFLQDSKRNSGWTNILHYGLMVSGGSHPLWMACTPDERQLLAQAQALILEKLKTLRTNESIYGKFYARIGTPV